jgi:hypothetical integral membrane protein (TIGR02206 family)
VIATAWTDGANTAAPFRPFSVFHFAFLLGTPLAAYLLSQLARRSERALRFSRVGLAIVLCAIGLSWYVVRLFIWHEAWRDALPLEMCDASLWLTVFALLWVSQGLRELAFYWAISGGYMALLTPDLREPQSSFRALTFLFGHAGLVIAGVFLLRACGLRLRRNSWWKAWAALNVYAVGVGAVDLLLHTDYMFLCAKPAAPSRLYFKAPSPFYSLSADLLALLLFYVMFRVAHARTRPRSG